MLLKSFIVVYYIVVGTVALVILGVCVAAAARSNEKKLPIESGVLSVVNETWCYNGYKLCGLSCWNELFLWRCVRKWREKEKNTPAEHESSGEALRLQQHIQHSWEHAFLCTNCAFSFNDRTNAHSTTQQFCRRPDSFELIYSIEKVQLWRQCKAAIRT